ncbi:MAG: ABC transporter substrate-binding protein [Clostridiales bacterium]|nr:ABC transporter substrate-binding protein [Clostridiales bacterium]
MRRFFALLLAVCLGLTLMGCQEEAPLPSPTETPAPTPTRTPEAVRFSLGYDPAATLHPIAGDSQVNRELAGLVYQGLYELDNSFSPQPVLAASGAPSEDGYSWSFTLNTGALFSDGTPVSARYAASSLNAARTSASYAPRLAEITDVTAVDDATLVVYLSAPNGDLPALLDVPVVLEREDVPAPLGTGYYQYEAAGDRLYLQTNPYNAGAAALPYATIPLTPVSGADERIASFDSGAVTAVTTEFSDPYALGYSSSYETCDYPTTAMLFVGFRSTGGPCQSELVRQAFSRAIDREGMVRTLLSGHADPANLPVSPLCGDYDGESAALLDYDLEGAAELLAQSGYERNEEDGLLYRRNVPLAVTLLVNSDNESRQAVADTVAAALTELGVSVTVNSLSWSNYTAALTAGQFDLYIGEVRLTGDFDPSPLLTGSLSYGVGGNGGLVQALETWKAAQGEERGQAAKALWARFVQAAPIAPICFKRGSLLVRWGMVSGLQPTRANPFYRMEEWTTTSNR